MFTPEQVSQAIKKVSDTTTKESTDNEAVVLHNTPAFMYWAKVLAEIDRPTDPIYRSALAMHNGVALGLALAEVLAEEKESAKKEATV